MREQNSVLSTLGLALRASRLAVGDEPVREAMQTGKVRLILLASDAGDAIVRRMERLAQDKDRPVVTLPDDKQSLGQALGRSSCAVCALLDVGFAQSVLQKLAQKDATHQPLADTMTQKQARTLARRQEGTNER